MTQYIDDEGTSGTASVRGYLDIEAGTGYFKIGSVAVNPTATQMNLLLQATTAGYKLAIGTASVTTSAETATGLATVIAGIACLQDNPNITGSYATVAASTTAGNILLQVWKPTSSTNNTPLAATKSAVKVNWLAVGT